MKLKKATIIKIIIYSILAIAILLIFKNLKFFFGFLGFGAVVESSEKINNIMKERDKEHEKISKPTTVYNRVSRIFKRDSGSNSK